MNNKSALHEHINESPRLQSYLIEHNLKIDSLTKENIDKIFDLEMSLLKEKTSVKIRESQLLIETILTITTGNKNE